MAEYLVFASCHGAMTAAVFVTARTLLRGIGRTSESRRTHGRYVLAWSVAGFADGPVAALLVFEDQPRGGFPATLFASWVFGMLSLLAGWLAGTVHGGLALAWRLARGGRAVPQHAEPGTVFEVERTEPFSGPTPGRPG